MKRNFINNGYLIKKFFKKIYRKELFKILNEILIKEKYFSKNKFDWEHEVLNKKLILLRKKPKIFLRFTILFKKQYLLKKF